MIDFNLKEIEERIDKGLIRENKFGNLSVYNYTSKCQFEGCWDKWTRMCRGLIYDHSSNYILALPFPKFFNLNEVEETKIENLPNEVPEVTIKYDGSLGIGFYNKKGNFVISTRGSLESDQAIWATKFLKENYNISDLPDYTTFLFEIIYPENKIVIDYGDLKDLILIGAIDTNTGYEFSREGLEEIAKLWGFSIVSKVDCSLGELIGMREDNNLSVEGFVLKYSDGLRVKIKTEEYKRVHKFIDKVTPLSVWKHFCDTKTNLGWGYGFPRHIYNKLEDLIIDFENKYNKIYNEAKNEFNRIKIKANSRKEFALILEEEMKNGLAYCNHSLWKGLQFAFFDKNEQKIIDIVFKIIKPNGEEDID